MSSGRRRTWSSKQPGNYSFHYLAAQRRIEINRRSRGCKRKLTNYTTVTERAPKTRAKTGLSTFPIFFALFSRNSSQRRATLLRVVCWSHEYVAEIDSRDYLCIALCQSTLIISASCMRYLALRKIHLKILLRVEWISVNSFDLCLLLSVYCWASQLGEMKTKIARREFAKYSEIYL